MEKINARNKIENVFRQEFASIETKFHLIDLPVVSLLVSKDEFICNPGVYVFYRGEEVIKVGRNFTNCRKRAWQHIRDNTKVEQLEMKNLQSDPLAQVLLINLKDIKDFHWSAVVEVFLEVNLKPLIRSKRLG
ncbi:hypothetical protein SAMN03080617_04285 [Algoriphagus alkaliphilus]|uniref:GIY-YIG domain-containing protein n=1 Tax=Algoriphagus alkaliphilus TaxID=279824 RepID=A0A1G5ZPP1_9BACT|nr:hypothetical protein [Algoriphagus alkaliphilus]SDA96779.1 hypothetical protein SAMN03080617_04285 [Algoriphagus alkaliphilus]